MRLPYSTSTAGPRALEQLRVILQGRMGCKSFGILDDHEQGFTMVQFRYRSREVQVQASHRGYAALLLTEMDTKQRTKLGEVEAGRRAMAQARLSVCSVLRDWIKGQVVAIECGVMSFEEAFLPHLIGPTGERVIAVIRANKLLDAPSAAASS